jgi:hypothetical protein
LVFIWIQSIKPLTFKIILGIWKRKLHFFPHFNLNLLVPSFLQLPSICNCYTFILHWQNENNKNGHTKHLGNYDLIHINLKHTR